MKRNMCNRILAAALLLSVVLLTGCRDVAQVPEDPTEVQTELTLDQRSVILNVGDTLQLTANGADEVFFTSSDPEVASVDDSGKVQAQKKGTAMITATGGGLTAKCGILVEPAGQMLDLTNTKASAVFSNVQLYHQNEIVDFAADAQSGAFYMSQQYGQERLVSDTMITKITQVDGVWQRSEYVHLYNHGFGYFDIEKDGADTYLLTESNGAGANQGTTISRVIWESGVMYDEEFGDTFELPGLDGGPRPQSDADNDVIVVYDFYGRESTYLVYDRSALLNGEENAYLHRFSCASRQTPVNGEDDSDGKYNSAIRGFAVKDGFIYQLSGNGKIYISVFDLQGNLQYCHEVEEYAELSYRAPGGISFSGDELYIAVNSAENTTLKWTHVWKIEEVTE